MTEVAANKRKMKELEDNLLYHLTSTTGSLVEDETLIEALTVTKETAHEVNEKLSIAAENEVRINSAREEFRPGRSDRYSADQRFRVAVLSVPHDVSGTVGREVNAGFSPAKDVIFSSALVCSLTGLRKNYSTDFYRATLCVSAVFAVARCLSVCLSRW